MDPVRNPFAPGAGSQPPALAGRGAVLQEAETVLLRTLQGRHGRSQMLLGLRGVGKTVLLNKIEELAENANYLTALIEAPEGRPLADLLVPHAHSALRKLSTVAAARGATHDALRALRSFAGAFKVSFAGVGIAVDAAPGIADSGDLEFDLPELFQVIGKAAQAAGRGWCLLIDEVQYLSQPDLAALIVSLHRMGQRGLPILFFGAGLPQVAALSGDAKSYAERLFSYPEIGPLPDEAARDAITQPIRDEGEAIDPDAVDEILSQTAGYPFFLQEWGYQAWNHAAASPISRSDVDLATRAAIQRLDDGFFRVRFDRLTPKEKDYVRAMASLGAGPYRSADVADALGERITALGPRRAQIISKGMIYSPGYGDIDFTVPMFDDYLRRTKPD